MNTPATFAEILATTRAYIAGTATYADLYRVTRLRSKQEGWEAVKRRVAYCRFIDTIRQPIAWYQKGYDVGLGAYAGKTLSQIQYGLDHYTKRGKLRDGHYERGIADGIRQMLTNMQADEHAAFLASLDSAKQHDDAAWAQLAAY